MQNRFHAGKKRCCWVFLVVLLLWPLPASPQTIPIIGYYGRYNAEKKAAGFPSSSFSERRHENWRPAVAKRPYHIGVLLPHLKDSYWLAADYGIVTRVNELGLRLTLYTAGAYINLGNQLAQLKHLSQTDRVDGIILASLDYLKLDPFVAEVVGAGIPVVELINDIHAPMISAKSMVSFYDMGRIAGEFVCADASTDNVRIAFFPGPSRSGWAPDTYNGFMAAMEKLRRGGRRVTVLPPLYGDTRPDVQRMRLDTLNQPGKQKVDYIVGNAVCAVEAVNYLREHRDFHPHAKIVATYLTPTVYEQIKNGTIQAAPSDQTITQCRIAVDMLVKLLNGQRAGRDFPFRAAPQIPLVTPDTVGGLPYEALFGKPGFQPVFSAFAHRSP